MMKWDEMSPRERDALVAEKVIGWTDFSPINPDVDYEAGVNGHRRNFAFSPSEKYQPIPHYTTDISAAWEVVEKLNTERRPYCYVQVKIGAEMGGCEASVISHYKSDDLIAVVFCDTAPEAICKVALKVVGVCVD